VAPENGLERWKLADALQQVLPLVGSVGKQQAVFPHLENIAPRHFQGQELGEPATQHNKPPDLLEGVWIGQADTRKLNKQPHLGDDKLVAVHELKLAKPLLETLIHDVDAHQGQDQALHYSVRTS
jgi:hypothetical protein